MKKLNVTFGLIESLLKSVSGGLCFIYVFFPSSSPFFVASLRSLWQKTPACQAGLLWDEPVNHSWRHPDNMCVKN